MHWEAKRPDELVADISQLLEHASEPELKNEGRESTLSLIVDSATNLACDFALYATEKTGVEHFVAIAKDDENDTHTTVWPGIQIWNKESGTGASQYKVSVLSASKLKGGPVTYRIRPDMSCLNPELIVDYFLEKFPDGKTQEAKYYFFVPGRDFPILKSGFCISHAIEAAGLTNKPEFYMFTVSSGVEQPESLIYVKKNGQKDNGKVTEQELDFLSPYTQGIHYIALAYNLDKK